LGLLWEGYMKKHTLFTLGLSAMLSMPLLAVAGPTSTSGSHASGTRMEHQGRQATGPEQVKEAQKQLKEAGFDPGPIDGRLGEQTHQAIREFQKDSGLPQTGQLDEPTKELLMAQRMPQTPGRMEPMPGSGSGRPMGSEPPSSGRDPGTLGGSGSSSGSGIGSGR